jgi:hypothetical protein
MTIYPFASETTRPRKAPDRPHGVTGRDSYIIAEALYCFIAYQQQLPDRKQSWSNLQDARAIFNACCGKGNAVFFADHYPGVTVSLVDEKAPRDYSE